MRATCRALWLGFCILFAGLALGEGRSVLRVSLSAATVTQLQAAAAAAFEAGDAAQALQLVDALLQKEPDNPLAHYIAARIFYGSGQFTLAQRAARKAYFAGRSPVQRYQATVIAAKTATAQEQWTRASLWTRASAFHAPAPQARESAHRDLATLRRLNPWSVQVSATISPSSNVNGGAESAQNIIEGFQTVGQLSADAQALAGVEKQANISLGLRLAEDAESRTQLSFSQSSKRVALRGTPLRSRFDPATATFSTAPISDRDFASDVQRLGLMHQELTQFGLLQGALGLGQSLEAGQPLWRSRSLSAQWSGLPAQMPQPDYLPRLSAAFEQRDYRSRDQSDQLRQLAFGLTRLGAPIGPDAARNRITAEFSLLSLGSTQPNARQTSVSAELSYSPAKSIAGAQTTFSLTATQARFRDYAILGMSPAGGRRDDTLGVSAEIVLPALAVAGFAPELTLDRSQSQSNISRFTRASTSIGLGFRSAF